MHEQVQSFGDYFTQTLIKEVALKYFFDQIRFLIRYHSIKYRQYFDQTHVILTKFNMQIYSQPKAHLSPINLIKEYIFVKKSCIQKIATIALIKNCAFDNLNKTMCSILIQGIYKAQKSKFSIWKNDSNNAFCQKKPTDINSKRVNRTVQFKAVSAQQWNSSGNCSKYFLQMAKSDGTYKLIQTNRKFPINSMTSFQAINSICFTEQSFQDNNEMPKFIPPLNDSISMLDDLFPKLPQADLQKEMIFLQMPFQIQKDREYQQNEQNIDETEKSYYIKNTDIEERSERIDQEFTPIDEQEILSVQFQQRKGKSKQNSETKNIPKNFGRAIITFILNHQKLVKRVLEVNGDKSIKNFKIALLKMKKTIKTISGIRSMWLDDKCVYAKQIRILSEIFLKKHCIGYIFNSRIKNYALNIKYKAKILQAVKKPHQFTSLKEF